MGKAMPERNYLHAVRAVAALLVLLGHARGNLLGSLYNFTSTHFWISAAITRILYWPFLVPQLAVVVFFVLSGYLVGGKLLRTDPDAPGVMTDYVVDRLSRIYTVAIPALIVSVAIFWGLAAWLGSTRLVQENDALVVCSPRIGDVLSNLLLLNKIFVPTLCSDAPYWSIQNEMSYYIIAGLVFFAVARRRKPAQACLALAVLAGVLWVLAREPLSLWHTLLLSGFWFLGAAIAIPARPMRYAAVAAILVAYAAVSVAWRAGPLNMRDLVCVAIATAASICFVRQSRVAALFDRPPVARLAVFMSERSYSLYLFHFPVVIAVAAIARSRGLMLGTVPVTPAIGWLLVAVAIAMGMAWSFLMWLLFEKHTMAVRRAIKGWLHPRAAEAPPAS